tara:strand:- start:285 stop:473 length:189 start_codon:yes stop_codon:yes gene_type:complete
MPEDHSRINGNITKAAEVLSTMISAAAEYTSKIDHEDCMTYAEASLISASLQQTLKKLSSNG